jgi:dTDP-glucose pyrophosphorylase
MKAVILAGGFGTRISEESHPKPKPMIEIGGRPATGRLSGSILANTGSPTFLRKSFRI